MTVEPSRGRVRTGRGEQAPQVTGVLNVAKPAGLTSFQVVRVARRVLGERHVGHAGTLDPVATGVLPLCLGRATRLVEYLLEEPKTYHAVIRLGERSDTGDLEGTVTAGRSAAEIAREQVAEALATFVGRIEQIPPMHSAVRHGGRHLYELARAGVEVERQARVVEVHRVVLLDWRPGTVAEAEVEVECGRGTYLRVLASDLGERLGTGGVLGWLERTRYGPFRLSDAIPLAELETAADPRAHLLPPEAAVASLPRVDLLPAAAMAVRRGGGAWLSGPAPLAAGTVVRAHALDGRLLAIGEVHGGHFRPLKVLAPLGG
ncbi:MAG TPA: tRNA pseudouridine(55) synthase TruB [Verrucomicrobiae bacterium]|nr:tRNA pseudouridine(55) synthase TruB [Verrucomicrobiae bacterium]